MKMLTLTLATVVLAAVLAGCRSVDLDRIRDILPTPPDNEELPAPLPDNPAVPPNGQNTSAQLYYLNYKSYDDTFRIRWPSYFATDMGIGAGSYTLINGQRAGFRSFDTDRGAKRPSYHMPGPASRLQPPYLCILHAADGRAIAWFETPGFGEGRLP